MQDATETQWEAGLDALETDESELELDAGAEAESPLDEVEEMEAAAALLEVTDEAGLDRFLGGLLKKATRRLGRVVPTSVLRAVGGHAKGAIKKALPGLARSAAGALGLDDALAGPAADAAGRMLGLELEGLSHEDREFEIARRLVRFTGSAARQAAHAVRSGNVAGGAIRALESAARQHAPGLLRSTARLADQAGIDNRPFGSEQELELAGELLEVTDEAELDQFLGKVIKQAKGSLRDLLDSPRGRALKDSLRETLKRCAGRMLPASSGATGAPATPPTAPEGEEEFETARRFVRLAGSASRRAARYPSVTPPRAAARSAVAGAARRYAPELLRRAAPGSPVVHCHCGASLPDAGTWRRDGENIVMELA